ncbi:MAG: hypothetical protein R3F12_08640 [Lysobacteraceae bacterium]
MDGYVQHDFSNNKQGDILFATQISRDQLLRDLMHLNRSEVATDRQSPSTSERHGAHWPALDFSPVAAPSSAGSRREKARLFEAMDGRVRAGRRVPSNAGNGSEADARTSGAFSFGYFSFGQAKKSDSLARRDSESF